MSKEEIKILASAILERERYGMLSPETISSLKEIAKDETSAFSLGKKALRIAR